MEKAKRTAYLALALLCILVPFSLLVVIYQMAGIPSDLAAYAYFAVTDPIGEETIYAHGDETHAGAAAAFVQAVHVSALPDSFADALFLSTEWIQYGRAQTWRMYLSPSSLEGYLVDERGNVYRMREEGALFFLQQEFATMLLAGDAPPALTVDGQLIPFSLCSWTYTIDLPDGTVATLSSGEYQSTEGAISSMAPHTFLPQFAKIPVSTSYTVYYGAEKIVTSESIPDFSCLSSGDYQLVLIAEWQEENTCIRAGYSFFFHYESYGTTFCF